MRELNWWLDGFTASQSAWQRCFRDEGSWHLPDAVDPQKLIEMLWVCLSDGILTC